MSFPFSLRSSLILIFIIVSLLSFIFMGCSGGSGDKTSLIVEINTSNSGAFNPATSDLFQVELLNESGEVEIDYREVARDWSNDAQTVIFSYLEAGGYRVRISAFNAENVILGSFNKAVTLTQGVNTMTVQDFQLAETYYSDANHLPQGRTPEGLTNFVSYDQAGIQLQSYCFWGKLFEDGKPQNAYMSIIQRMDKNLGDMGTYLFPFVIAGAGYNNESTGRIIFGGAVGIAELTEAVVVTQPWSAYVSCPNPDPEPYPFNTVEMKIISGTMGQAGAQYKIISQTIDLEKVLLETSVVVTDTMGFVNEGYGPSSFFPQWLLDRQRTTINENYGGSIESYLESTGDPMTDQGSYYYSAPMLEVESFKIIRNGKVISQGTDGLLWADIVYQSFDTDAINIVRSATWNFFSIQFPDLKQAMMVTSVKNDSNGTLKAASLFTTTATRARNGALNPEYRWGLKSIEIKPAPDCTWTSPESKLTYNTKYIITLTGERTANLTVTLIWNAQELIVKNQTTGHDTVKYEGLADVQGTLDGAAVRGPAWVELQPAGGHL